MILFPKTKINIGLAVVAKRPDGFHNIASCFYPIGWSDILEILPAEKTEFICTGLSIEGPIETNLCWRAYQLLSADFSLPPLRIHLHKIVPMGAGLGGGSADAAATLLGINAVAGLGLSDDMLEDYARRLGSDCAFFVGSQPRFCTEKGDVFEEISLNLSGKYIVLVYPGVHSSTAEAYSGVRVGEPPHDLRTALLQPMSSWKELIINDFEAPIAEKYPIITTIKIALYATGAGYAAMSGSGSTVFGLFEDEPSLPDFFDEFSVWKGVL